jgi:hypothetical protein
MQPPQPQPKIAPSMPHIPGVPDVRATAPSGFKPLVAVTLAALLCAGGITLWLVRRHSGAPAASASSESAAAEPAISDPTATNPQTGVDRDAVATVDELAKPWSSKSFNFIDPKTHARIPAMIIRLPSPGTRAESYWAFSTKAPFSNCELKFVSDLAELSQRYTFTSSHPMVVSTCEGTLYDPLKMATLPDGSWVRGEIERGGGLRPPLAVQIHLHGNSIVADRSE